MITTINLKCEECGEPIVRRLATHNANMRKGYRIFCNHRCNALFMQKRKMCCDISQFKNTQKKVDQYSPFRYLIGQIKHRAKKRGYGMNLTPEYLKEIWDIQKGVCPYSGLNMTFFNLDTKRRVRSGLPTQISVDRIDSSQGYIQGNIELVCLAINYAKNGFSREVMKDFVKEIVSAHLI